MARSPCLQVGKGSEDCLYFNMWIPVAAAEDKLMYTQNSVKFANNLNNLKYIQNGFNKYTNKPTMFWIHGGFFTEGSSLSNGGANGPTVCTNSLYYYA